jgi:hypothetical protein
MKYFDRSQILGVFDDEGKTVFRKRAKKKHAFSLNRIIVSDKRFS